MADEPQTPWYGDKWKGNETVSRFKDQDALINSFIETKSKIGRSVELPAELTFDAVRPIMDRLGAPKDVSAYKLPDDPITKEVAGIFLEAGVLPSQAEKIMAGVVKANKAIEDGRAAKLAEVEASIQKEWGEAAVSNAEKLSRFESANKETLEGKLYQAALKEDPKAAKEWALKQAAAAGVTVGKGPAIVAPTGKDDAAAKIAKYRKEAVEAATKGEKHWWNNPSPDQQKFKMDLYSLVA